MVDVGRKIQIDGMQRNRSVVTGSLVDRIGTRIVAEEVIERPVLLDDDYDVLDVLVQLGSVALHFG